MERTITQDRFRALAQKAFASGTVLPNGHGLKWPAAGRCEAPIQVLLRTPTDEALPFWWKPTAFEGGYDRPDEMPDDWIFPSGKSRPIEWEPKYFPYKEIRLEPSFDGNISNTLVLEVMTRCRKCADCLDNRRRFWTARAMEEFKLQPEGMRTWFVTLTYSPQERFQLLLRARLKYGGEDFAALARASGVYVTRFFKRLRKNTGMKFRYLVVHEQHADGFPHVHMLVHESTGHVTKREVQREWPFGFTVVKLADIKTARYVCKYVSKDAMARVRASINYGRSKQNSDIIRV